MRRRTARVFGLCMAGAFGVVGLIAACGARTGLEVLQPPPDATRVDVHHEPDAAEENPFDAPGQEGHPLDVMPECATPTYCGSNPNFIYKCGVPIYQCGSLEQCFEPCGDVAPGDACAAECINPCLHTLGQNTSNGCEFYAVEMDTSPDTAGACYAVFVVNQWQTGEAAKIEVDHGGKPYSNKELEGFARIPSGTGTRIKYGKFDAEKGLPQNEIAIFFLSREPNIDAGGDLTAPNLLAGCPAGVRPAVAADAATHGTGTGGTAFHIRSNVPIVAYQMMPYGGGHARVTGATLLLPKNVWGTNYIAANAYAEPVLSGEDVGSGPTLAVVAQQDRTHVTIDPVVAIKGGGGLAGTKAGVPVTYTLGAGEYFQISQGAELTGSTLEADAPIAVFGGSMLMDIPVHNPNHHTSHRADHGEQMLPPVSALANEYVAVRYRSRSAPEEETVPWRVVGAVDGTTLTYDPATPTGAPTRLDRGQLVEFWDPGPWVVSSQDAAHPFYMAQYMTGGSYILDNDLPKDAGADVDAGPDTTSNLWGQGDPEFVNVVPPAQYLPGYTFFTDPTYPETNLVVVASKDPASGVFPSVSLDCAGALSGWQSVGTSGKYQFTRIDLSTGNYQGQNGCNNGVHRIEAVMPTEGGPPGDLPKIGVTVWGWGSQTTIPDNPITNETSPDFTCWVSYAYPAGANFGKLNNVFVPAK